MNQDLVNTLANCSYEEAMSYCSVDLFLFLITRELCVTLNELTQY